MVTSLTAEAGTAVELRARSKEVPGGPRMSSESWHRLIWCYFLPKDKAWPPSPEVHPVPVLTLTYRVT